MANSNSNKASAQAVLAFANTAAGKALGACSGSAMVRAAIAAGAVPGVPASYGTPAPRHTAAGTAVHAIGSAYRGLHRGTGNGARANGHTGYAAMAASGNTTHAALASATAKAAAQAAKAAAKAQAAQAPQVAS